MLGKLGGAVQGVELFNEPHLWRFHDGPRKDFPNMPPRKVAKFYQIAREEIDRANSPIRLRSERKYPIRPNSSLPMYIFFFSS